MKTLPPPTPAGRAMGNECVADHLREVAELLDGQGANPFRVGAYRRAAETVRGLAGDVAALIEAEGPAGLRELPGIGETMARAIEQIVQSGHLSLLDRLRGEAAPERIFTTVADIGPRLAERIHEELGIESLAELEAAVWDGRLARVHGMGKKRLQAVRESLAGRLHRDASTSKFQSAHSPQPHEPPVAELLAIDQEYRNLAETDRLPRISPRRFNPEGRAWLPIYHAERGDHHYTALYSNTARAHELGTTRDWVVIYRDDADEHGQWTIITSHFGRLKGHRIVRGREEECAHHYAREKLAHAPHEHDT